MPQHRQATYNPRGRLGRPPGAWSSQRHWHSAEDEFTYVLEGEVVLVTDTDAVDYPAIDLILAAGERAYRHRNGSPY